MKKVIDINPTLCYPYMVSNDHSDHVQQYDVGAEIMNVRACLLNKVVDTPDNRCYNDYSIQPPGGTPRRKEHQRNRTLSSNG